MPFVARNLLAIHKLDAFTAWLDKQGIEHRPTDAAYQVLQVRVVGDPRWHPIYKKDAATVHLSVPGALVSLVRKFVHEGKYAGRVDEHQLKPTVEHAADNVPWG